MAGSNANIAWDRLLARLLVKPIARAPIHPNLVTTLGMVAGLAAGLMFAQGDPVLADWAALLFILAAFLDHVDGELARMTGKTSEFGHYYDHFAAGVSYFSLFIGIGFGAHAGFLGEWSVPLGVLAGVAVVLIMSVRIGMEIREGREAVRQGNIAGFEPEDTLYIVGPVTWLGGVEYFLVAAGIGAPLFLMGVLAGVLWKLRRKAEAGWEL